MHPLEERLTAYPDGVLVAFSGGVDSALVLAAALTGAVLTASGPSGDSPERISTSAVSRWVR